MTDACGNPRPTKSGTCKVTVGDSVGTSAGSGPVDAAGARRFAAPGPTSLRRFPRRRLSAVPNYPRPSTTGNRRGGDGSRSGIESRRTLPSSSGVEDEIISDGLQRLPVIACDGGGGRRGRRRRTLAAGVICAGVATRAGGLDEDAGWPRKLRPSGRSRRAERPARAVAKFFEGEPDRRSRAPCAGRDGKHLRKLVQTDMSKVSQINTPRRRIAPFSFL